MAKKIIRESKAIKLALGLEHDAKKLERVLGSAKAHLPSQVYNLLSPQPQPLLFYLLANTKNAKVQNRIKSFLFKFPQIHSRLPRAELQSLGVKPGPEFDRILAKIFALQLDGKIKSHPQLMKEMRELAGIKEPPPPPPAPLPKKGKETAPEPPAAHPRKKGRESAAPPPAPQPQKGKETTPAPPAAAPPALPPKPAAKPAAKALFHKAARPDSKTRAKLRAKKAAAKPAAKAKLREAAKPVSKHRPAKKPKKPRKR